MLKVCNICGEEKDISKFRKNKDAKDGYRNQCRLCENIKNNKYSQTRKEALYRYIIFMYSSMLGRVNGLSGDIRYRYLYKGKEIVNRKDFYKFAYTNWDLKVLFSNWKYNNYNKKLTPSVDRIDTSKGYTLDNIRFITLSENSKLGSITGIKTRWGVDTSIKRSHSVKIK